MKSKLGSTELTKTVEICRYPKYRGTFLFACDNPIRQSYATGEKLHITVLLGDREEARKQT